MMQIRGYWWLNCPLATFLEEGAKRYQIPSGRGPCTGCGNGGTSGKFNDLALFTIQTNAVTYDRGMVK
jgi:hypothetical protein